MSHATGMCRFDSDGLVMFFDYNGTVDLCVSHLVDTYEEVWGNIRRLAWLDCEDGKDEPCVLFTDYGNGFYWEGRACRHCRAITKGTSPYDLDDGDIEIKRVVPEWAKAAYPWAMRGGKG